MRKSHLMRDGKKESGDEKSDKTFKRKNRNNVYDKNRKYQTLK